MGESQTINISTSTIFRTVIILLGLVLIYLIRDILLIVLVAIILAAAINGPVSWLQKHRIPRLLGVIFIYLFILLLVASIVTLVFPPLSEQVKQLATHFPEFMEKISLNVQELWGKYQTESNLQALLDKLSNNLSQAASNIFGTIINLFGGLFSAVVVLVISFYLAVQERGVRKLLVSLTPQEHQHYLSDLIDRIQIKIGNWLRGQLLLMLIVGILVFIGLYFLGVEYALTLALVAGILEIVPYAGPIMAAVPAVILAFTQSPLLALLVVILYIIVQQLENYVLTPQIMKKAVGLNPIVIIIVMLIGAKLAGVMGIILSVPLTAAAMEFFGDFQK